MTAARHGNPVGQQVRLRRACREPISGTTARRTLGVRARVAPRAVADRSRHGLRRRPGRGALSLDRRRHVVARARAGFASTARARRGSQARAACASTPSCSIRRTPIASTSPSPPPARSARTTAAKTWKPINRGLESGGIPKPEAEVGHCVHHIAMNASRPNVLFMQKHWDVMRSDNAGDSWQEVSGNLPTDFGFAIDVHAHEPDTIYVVPIKSDSEHFPPDGKLRVFRSRSGGNEWEPLTKGLPQSNCYVNVLRDAMAVDSLDSCGMYFGTTGGQVYVSPDGGRQLDADRSRIFRRSCPSRCRHCNDSRRSARPPPNARPRQRRGASSTSPGRRHRSARSSMRWKRLTRCCAARSGITSRRNGGRSCGSSHAKKTGRTSAPTCRCPTPSLPAPSRCHRWRHGRRIAAASPGRTQCVRSTR